LAEAPRDKEKEGLRSMKFKYLQLFLSKTAVLAEAPRDKEKERLRSMKLKYL
jgi:hypothetical protein